MALRAIERTSGMSRYSTPRPSAYTSSFSAITWTICVEYPASQLRRATGPSIFVPSNSWPAASTAVSPSFARHPPELAAVDVRNAVVPGQPFVDERVVGCQQIHHVAVFAHDAVEQELHFAPHRLAQRIVEVGIDQRQRAGALQAAQVQPLPRE